MGNPLGFLTRKQSCQSEVTSGSKTVNWTAARAARETMQAVHRRRSNRTLAHQESLFSPLADVDFFRHLIADLHDDIAGKVARFRQLADLTMEMGTERAMIPGGETAFASWLEARSSFVQGNFVATVMLCQGLAEHMLASHLAMGLDSKPLPKKIEFHETLKRCLADGVISARDEEDLRRLMSLRNPLSHYQDVEHPSNLYRRALDTRMPAREHLVRDATFAISMAVRLLALPSFRLGDGRTLLDEN